MNVIEVHAESFTLDCQSCYSQINTQTCNNMHRNNTHITQNQACLSICGLSAWVLGNRVDEQACLLIVPLVSTDIHFSKLAMPAFCASILLVAEAMIALQHIADK